MPLGFVVICYKIIMATDNGYSPSESCFIKIYHGITGMKGSFEDGRHFCLCPEWLRASVLVFFV
jgi:hypothetical protein